MFFNSVSETWPGRVGSAQECDACSACSVLFQMQHQPWPGPAQSVSDVGCAKKPSQARQCVT